MIYDTAIIGAGASGLFAGSCLAQGSGGKVVILEKGKKPGRKLLMAGSGQCNLTHSGSIKDFPPHYGCAGPQIRTVLYRFSNEALMSFFQQEGCPLFSREDGKVFPKSMRGSDVLSVLLASCQRGGVEFRFSSPVTSLRLQGDVFCLTFEREDRFLQAKRVVVATGGCSYPASGSDGNFFPMLADLGLRLTPRRPALAPIYVQDYPYSELSGISFSPALLRIEDGKNGEHLAERKEDLLLTHRCFSGPAALNLSRYAKPGQNLVINYLPGRCFQEVREQLQRTAQGQRRQTLSFLCRQFPELSKRFLELLCRREDLIPSCNVSSLPGSRLKNLAQTLTEDRFSISGVGGYSCAMVTAGGVALQEINLKTMESKSCPRLYVIGEALDVDGDTGGYNLQFAFSSAHAAATGILSLPSA